MCLESNIDGGGKMQVHKMGGKLLCDALGFKKAREIMGSLPKGKYLIVVSAVVLVTRLLTQIFDEAKNGNLSQKRQLLEKLQMIHRDIITQLFQGEGREKTLLALSLILRHVESNLEDSEFSTADKAKLLSFGELLSSMILYRYLRETIGKSKVAYVPAFEMIRTSGPLLEAEVLKDRSQRRVKEHLSEFFYRRDYVVTEGFIGRDEETNQVSLLGFDGSDTSAAWFGKFLKADDVTYWKDVLGVLKTNPDGTLSSKVFAGMTFEQLDDYLAQGCKVINSNAVDPLRQDRIITVIRSFNDLANPGTIIV
jgi:aspartate kinase